MPLTREEILALRRQFEQEFGTGEADWADTTPEGISTWERSHPHRWLLDAGAVDPFDVRCRAYTGVVTISGVDLSGSVITMNSGPSDTAMNVFGSTGVNLQTHVHTICAARVNSELAELAGEPMVQRLIAAAKAPLEKQFEVELR